jgi:hypothetical protein
MNDKEQTDAELEDDDTEKDDAVETEEDTEVEAKTVRRGRGRPKGSKNKPKFQVTGNTIPSVK